MEGPSKLVKHLILYMTEYVSVRESFPEQQTKQSQIRALVDIFQHRKANPN